MNYDYRDAIVEDIKAVIGEYDYTDCTDLDEAKAWLYDQLWIDDSVTGNGSGSYTFNRAKAAEYIAGNGDLFVEAADAFGLGLDGYRKAFEEPEYCDLTIRCYLLGECLEAAFKDPEVQRKVMTIIDRNEDC